MNRGSTGRFVPPPVYIGFPLLVLAKTRSEQLFTVFWRARGTVSFRADRNVGTLFCPASPRPAVRRAPRRIDLPVVCPGLGLDKFPNMPCMKKAYRDKWASIHWSEGRNEERLRFNGPVESKTRTHNRQVDSARRTADGGAGRSWAEQGADISVGPEANRPSSPSGYRKQLF